MDDPRGMKAATELEPGVQLREFVTAAALPRLLYVGDVAVEESVAGSTLLYRLLQNYPASRLSIAEGNLHASRPDRRLPGVSYIEFKVGTERLLRTRFHSLYSSVLHLTAKARARRLDEIVQEFQPEAILTVAHGYSWLTAASLAKSLAVPLHLIVHDDWASIQKSVLPSPVHKSVERHFGEVYRAATTRLCVSPYMVEDFARRYGASGSVLYPSRAADVPEYDAPPASRRTVEKKLVFAFAGTINTRGYAESMRALTSALEETGGELFVYSNLTAEGIKDCGLDKDHVTVHSLLPFRELLESLRREVDVLFVPMSFAAEDLPNMQVAFPSKLADYTAVGLPLLIWGPPSSSAVRWGLENSGVAEVVERPEIEALKAAVLKLMHDTTRRQALAQTALTKGREFFRHDRVVEKFYQSICRISEYEER